MAAIEIKQGDNYPITLAVKQKDGTVYNMTDATNIIVAVDDVRSNISPEDADLTASGTIVSAAEGTVQFAPSVAMTALAKDTYSAEVTFDQGGYNRTSATFEYIVLGQIKTS